MLDRRSFLTRLPAVAALPGSSRRIAAATLFPMSAEGASPSASPGANYTAFWRALTAAQRAGGDVLVDGRYPINHLILDGITGAGIVGLGRGRSALIGGSGDNALLNVVRSPGVRVSGVDLVTQGITAVYGLTSSGLALTDVQTEGGRMAGIYLDRCPVARLQGAGIRGVRRTDGSIGGMGLWMFHGGSGLSVDTLTVEDTDGDGVRLDAGTTGDLLAEACAGALLRGLQLTRTGRAGNNAAAIMLEGARDVTVQSFLVNDAVHGLVLQQDQSTAVPSGNVITGGVFRSLTGHAAALIGARDNVITASWWDGSGAGALLTLPGLGGSGAASERNTVEITRPGR